MAARELKQIERQLILYDIFQQNDEDTRLSTIMFHLPGMNVSVFISNLIQETIKKKRNINKFLILFIIRNLLVCGLIIFIDCIGAYFINTKRVRDTSLRKFVTISGLLFVIILSLCPDTGSACYVTQKEKS